MTNREAEQREQVALKAQKLFDEIAKMDGDALLRLQHDIGMPRNLIHFLDTLKMLSNNAKHHPHPY